MIPRMGIADNISLTLTHAVRAVMRHAMRFFSDNAAAVCPQVMEALAKANRVDTAYDGDALVERLDGAFSDLFGKQVRALWVTTGTAANCLGLATLCPPHGAILCHEMAHIEVDEAGAPGFFTHGAKLTLLPGHGAKLTPETVEEACARVRDDVHQVQPAALSITNATEYGLSYRPDEVAALGEVAKRRGLGFHMDGARFANAVAFHRRRSRRPDLARRGRRHVVRLRQEWRDERRGADLLRPGQGRGRAAAQQARGASAVQGPLSRRADSGDAGK
jgi:hypothetical protein